MKDFRLRTDLERVRLGDFALPLGFDGEGLLPPLPGYTIAYTPGEGDDPDTYSFQVVVSSEKLPALCQRCFDLLPRELLAIVEIGSRDAYRSVDVFLGEEPIALEHFREVWRHYEPFLLEDGSIAAGANAEDPFLEVFVDQRKTIILHVPLAMRDEVESMLQEQGLEQVPETWPEPDDGGNGDGPVIRPVLDITDAYCPDVDEILLQLRHEWRLQLNLDPDNNVDEAGRELGPTLWHAVVIVFKAGDRNGAGAYMSVWMTAGSLLTAEQLIRAELDRSPEWEFGEIYTVDRVAYDERPDELADLSPRRTESAVHLSNFEPWADPPDEPVDG